MQAKKTPVSFTRQRRYAIATIFGNKRGQVMGVIIGQDLDSLADGRDLQRSRLRALLPLLVRHLRRPLKSE